MRRTTWHEAHPNLEAGSIVLVKYQAKFGKDRYRLARVLETREDEAGLVRTAWVGMRNLRRAVREEEDVCRAGLTFLELPVQRLVMVLPASEQPQEVLPQPGVFPPMPMAEARPLQVRIEGAEEEIVDLPRRRGGRARGAAFLGPLHWDSL